MSFLTIQQYRTPSRRNSHRARHFLVWMCIFVIPVAVIAGWLLLDYKHTPTQAAVGIPNLITYQGKVADSTGTAITNGDYNFLFQIYSASTGGTALWTESWTATTTAGAVDVINGTFSVALGTSTSLSTLDFNQDNLYLEIHFDADSNGSFEETFSPRKQLTSSPYSFNSDKLDGFTSSDFLSTTTYNAPSIGSIGSSSATTTAAGNFIVTGATRLASSLSGILKATAGYIATALVDLATDVTGTLGITNGGTGLSSTPSYGQLLVGNGSGYTLTATSSLGVAISDTTGTLAVSRGGTNATSQTTNGITYYNGTSITSGTGLVFDGTNLGVGTTTPSVRLSVDGQVALQGTNFATTTIGSNADYIRFEQGNFGGLVGSLPMMRGNLDLNVATNAQGIASWSGFAAVEDGTLGDDMPYISFASADVGTTLNSFAFEYATTSRTLFARGTSTANFVFEDSETGNSMKVGISTSTPSYNLSVEGIGYFVDNVTSSTAPTQIKLHSYDFLSGLVQGPVIEGIASNGVNGLGTVRELSIFGGDSFNPVINLSSRNLLQSANIGYATTTDIMSFNNALGGYVFNTEANSNTSLTVDMLDLSGGVLTDLKVPTIFGNTASSVIGELNSVGINNGLLIVEDSSLNADPVISFGSADIGDTANTGSISYSTSSNLIYFDKKLKIDDSNFDPRIEFSIENTTSSEIYLNNNDSFFFTGATGGYYFDESMAILSDDNSGSLVFSNSAGSIISAIGFETSTDTMVFIQASGGYYFDDEVNINAEMDVNGGSLVVDTTGMVGVNTTTPWASLSIRQTTGDYIMVGANSSNVTQFSVGGSGQIYSEWLSNSVGSDPLCWDGSGGSVIGDCTSLGKYKANRQDLELGLTEILQLQPRTFDWKRHADGSLAVDDPDFYVADVGFIAEEVEAVSPWFGKYDYDTNQLTGIRERGILAATVNATQELYGMVVDTSNNLMTLSQQVSNLTVSSASGGQQFNVGQATTFYGVITVMGEAGFQSRVTFSKQVYFNQDAAGTLTIEEGQSSVMVTFSEAYEYAPIITVTPREDASGYSYWIDEQGVDGFVLMLDDEADEDLEFNWHAVATTAGEQNTIIPEPEPTPGPVSTPESLPEPDPTPDSTPEPDPSPDVVPEPTPEPAPAPEPEPTPTPDPAPNPPPPAE